MRFWFDGFFMAWGMFLRLPVPVNVWNEEARPRMLAAFPLIGAVLGGIQLGAYYLCRSLPAGIFALVVAALPWLATGFMHIDGFMDVCDAALSSRDSEKKLKILKDPHCGSFAVICAVLLALAQWSAFLSMENIEPLVLLFIPMAVRSGAYFAFALLKPLEGSQYEAMRRDLPAALFSALVLAAALAAPVLLFGIAGLAACCALAVYAVCAIWGRFNIGGMNGDVSGFALCLGELAGYLLLAVI
ncbi:MAG TPA: adenosylcobinamide-GDP ribazoletransferase [Bacillota bacterium]|nr:adenosylcobinamide-GDP ribazoletransferase [Bacillota bacterium]